MNIRNSKRWNAAKYEFEALCAQLMLPLPGFSLSSEEIIDWSERIIEECPEFYPAVIESGMRRLAMGSSGLAEQRIEEGFHLLLNLADPEYFDEEIDIFIENLEKLWRFDLCKHYLELLIQRYPQNAPFHDSLAHALVRMGDVDKALLHIGKSIEMEPENAYFRANQGWIYLFAGNLKEAKDDFEASLRLNPDNDVVRRNLKVHNYLTKHGGEYLDYLLRPADMDEIDRLANEEEWEKVDELCGSYNGSRFEAMVQTILHEDKDKRVHIPVLLSTLGTFFRFVRKLDPGGYILNEDILFILENFKRIMHKFIFKHHDIDQEMIEDIYESLFEYYGFLARSGLVGTEEFKHFQKTTLGMKKELILKMQRYNEVRDDYTMDEDEKEDIREELFEGDHAWPFL